MGNQMFQYAFGEVLRSTGKNVCYDISWFNSKAANDRNYPRPLRLGKFQLSSFVIGELLPGNAWVYERRVNYNKKVFALRTAANFEGYWQYIDYYYDVLPSLSEEFQLKTETYTENFLKWAELIWNTESISVHVRLGDYKFPQKGKFVKTIPVQYYFRAIKEAPKGDLFFFSDSIDLCKEIFKPEYFDREMHFIDIEDYLAFELMRYCKHNIITNSTFSFWAALINTNKDKVVLRPRYWQWAPDKDGDDRYPKSWISINEK